MFVFLSKLLPYFIYPLGMTAILLLGSVLLRRRSGWARGCVIAALVVLLVSSNAWVPALLTRALEWRYLPLETYPQHGVIVVLGGSTGSATSPRPMVDIGGAGDRLLYAAHLYHQGAAPHILLTGGYIPWMSDRQAPAHDMAEVLQMLNVPESALWLETQSLNTYENAVYSREILAEKGIDHIILVTSALHMPRAVGVFEAQGFTVTPAPTDYGLTEADWARLWAPNLVTQLFNVMPSAGHLSDTTSAVKEVLGILIYSLRGWL